MTLDEMLARVLEELPEVDLADFVGKANSVQRDITGYRTGKWSWLLTSSQIVTVETYSDGTVDIAEDDDEVGGTGTTWVEAMEGRKLKFTGKPSIYTVETVTNTTTIVMDREFEHDTITDGYYDIYQDVYALPTDFRVLLDAIDLTTNRWLYFVSHSDYLKQYQPGQTLNGTGRFMATLEGSYLRLIDVPVNETTIQLWYYKRLPALAGITATPGVPDYLHELMLDALLADYMARYMGDSGNAIRRYGEQRAKYNRNIHQAWLEDQARNNPAVKLKRVMF